MPTRFVPLSSIERVTAGFMSPTRLGRLDRQIPVDAYTSDDGLTLHFDLPGVPEDQIDVTVERRVLTVRAERRSDWTENDHVLIAERPWGGMSRQIVLGDALDTDRISAVYENGVLSVKVPRRAEARSRRIEIRHAPVKAELDSASSSDTADEDSDAPAHS